MKTTKRILTYFILLTLFSCGQTRKASDGISKVTVAFSGYGCEGNCPFKVLSVDKNLELKYYGGPNSLRRGNYKGTVSEETWDSIRVCFDKFIIKGIDTSINEKTDHPEVEFFIHDGFRKHKTRFSINTGKLTSEDYERLAWFIELELKTNLNESDSLIFESSYQSHLNRKIKE